MIAAHHGGRPHRSPGRFRTDVRPSGTRTTAAVPDGVAAGAAAAGGDRGGADCPRVGAVRPRAAAVQPAGERRPAAVDLPVVPDCDRVRLRRARAPEGRDDDAQETAGSRRYLLLQRGVRGGTVRRGHAVRPARPVAALSGPAARVCDPSADRMGGRTRNGRGRRQRAGGGRVGERPAARVHVRDGGGGVRAHRRHEPDPPRDSQGLDAIHAAACRHAGEFPDGICPCRRTRAGG